MSGKSPRPRKPRTPSFRACNECGMENARLSLRPLSERYAEVPAAAFGPLSLWAIREQ